MENRREAIIMEESALEVWIIATNFWADKLPIIQLSSSISNIVGVISVESFFQIELIVFLFEI